jgi:hypothetical protein
MDLLALELSSRRLGSYPARLLERLAALLAPAGPRPAPVPVPVRVIVPRTRREPLDARELSPVHASALRSTRYYLSHVIGRVST